MLSFALHPNQFDGESAQIVAQAASISMEVMDKAMPGERVEHRLMDTNELANISASQQETPAGETDLRDYIICQNLERKEFGVPASTRQMSLIGGPTVVRDGNSSRFVRPFGFSIHEFGEGAVAIDEILDNIPRRLRSASALIVAYTTVHESGHLYRLVRPGSRRWQAGNHCGNLCVMATTPTTEATHKAIQAMGGRICICRECVTDLNRVIR